MIIYIKSQKPKRYWYRRLNGDCFVSDDPDLHKHAVLIHVGEAFADTEEDFNRAWNFYLENDLPF